MESRGTQRSKNASSEHNHTLTNKLKNIFPVKESLLKIKLFDANEIIAECNLRDIPPKTVAEEIYTFIRSNTYTPEGAASLRALLLSVTPSETPLLAFELMMPFIKATPFKQHDFTYFLLLLETVSIAPADYPYAPFHERLRSEFNEKVQLDYFKINKQELLFYLDHQAEIDPQNQTSLLNLVTAFKGSNEEPRVLTHLLTLKGLDAATKETTQTELTKLLSTTPGIEALIQDTLRLSDWKNTTLPYQGATKRHAFIQLMINTPFSSTMTFHKAFTEKSLTDNMVRYVVNNNKNMTLAQLLDIKEDHGAFITYSLNELLSRLKHYYFHFVLQNASVKQALYDIMILNRGCLLLNILMTNSHYTELRYNTETMIALQKPMCSLSPSENVVETLKTRAAGNQLSVHDAFMVTLFIEDKKSRMAAEFQLKAGITKEERQTLQDIIPFLNKPDEAKKILRKLPSRLSTANNTQTLFTTPGENPKSTNTLTQASPHLT